MNESVPPNSLFRFPDPEDYRRLNDSLRAAGFSNSGVIEALGKEDVSSLRGGDIPLLLHRTSGGRPVDTLIRLFLIDTPVDIDAAKAALAGFDLQKAIEAGIARIEGPSVIPLVRILPFQNLLVMSDLLERLESADCSDFVMGIGKSSLTLANLTVRLPSRHTLDLGAGCGIQGLLAAAHSQSVTAVDLNPRSVRIAEFNSKLNGLSNFECLEGDVFEPVRGCTFDLIVSNPPFVISPESRYIYRDSGIEADGITRKIVREVPGYLEEGGYCQVLCNWVEKRGSDWRERLAGWFEGTGCDVWVMRSETRDAPTYALTWIEHTEKAEKEAIPQRFKEWTAYYESRGIDSVGAGLITMRKSSGRANWFRADDGPERMFGPCGEHVVLGFELRDFLEKAKEDSALLGATLFASPDARLEQTLAPSSGGWSAVESRLKLCRGIGYSGEIDLYVANLIARCDGSRPLGTLMNELAKSLNADPSEISAVLCDIVRKLVEQGFLLPRRPGAEGAGDRQQSYRAC